MEVVSKDTTLYHISNSLTKLIEGRLIYFSDNLIYQTRYSAGLDYFTSKFATYDHNSNAFLFKNTRDLRLLNIHNELILNILQIKKGNQQLIYYLQKNNLDGFKTSFSFKCTNVNIYLILIKSEQDFIFKPIQLKRADFSYSCKQTVYFILTNIIMLLYYCIDLQSTKIYNNIKYNKRQDLIEFKKKYNDYSILSKQNNTLRICSYNVHFFRNTENKDSLKEVIKYIKQQNIDIVCLQEVVVPRKLYENLYLNTLDEVKHQLNNIGYYNIFFDEKSFLLIASRKKLENADIIDLSHNRKALSVDFYHNNSKINLTNTHLHINPNLNKTSNQEDEDIRFEQVKKLINLKKNYSKSIILGDFNSIDEQDYSYNEYQTKQKYEYMHTATDNKVIKYMKKYYNDCFVDGKLYTSIHRRRVDYVFYKGMHPPVYYNTSYFNDSDHSMIIVDLK